MRHADLRALQRTTIRLRDRTHAPEVSHVASFPRSALARARLPFAYGVLGHHRADAEIGALDPADGGVRRHLVQRWIAGLVGEMLIRGSVTERRTGAP